MSKDYCTCRVPARSDYHDNCINQYCDKHIKTSAEQIKDLLEEIDLLKQHKKTLLDAIEPFVKSGWDDLKIAKKKVLNEKAN